MTKTYWKTIAKRAWRESLASVRWNNWERILVTLAPLFAVFFATWYFLGDMSGALVKLVAAVGMTTVLAAIFFVSKLLTVPAKLQAEVEERLSATTKAVDKDAAQKDLIANRVEIVRQFAGLYVLSHDGITSRMMAGLELPPAKWLNTELANAGHNWRVRNISGSNFEMVED
ncbi:MULTISPECIES: hypothetical protein [unclassified Mesorhizobium]|uniref:hypothetical protein n=1 Tax=unclassified Mesorhizobium TaxID=325217 RepID=UPI0003CECBEB|nr:hypothetical protein [Mesorhizobium sp. LSHC420B00]ESX78839.1 hypothetical protein X759_15245 [Mesorhizobium sp. LSHC420B00]